MNKILEIKFGSHLYGTSTPKSDLDLKGIYLPTAKEIVLGNYKKTISTCRSKAQYERNNKDDVDIEIFSLDRFLELLTEGQTMALDMLFSDSDNLINMTTDGLYIMGEIWVNKDRLLTKNVEAFMGYAKQQCARYGIKGSRLDALNRTMEYLKSCGDERKTLDHYAAHFANLVDSTSQLVSLEKTPLVEIVMLKGPKGLMDAPHLKVNGRNIPFHATVKYAKEILSKIIDSYGERAHKAHLSSGRDYKALSHAARVNSEALELLTTGKITFPRPDRELLIKIKTEQMPYEEVAEIIEQGLVDLHEAQEKSILRDKPDLEWVDNFIYMVYSGIVKEG